MHHMTAVTRAIAYIEEHLADGITVPEIARLTGYSPYHFHRIFQSVTRCSIADYIRRRRLTHAAYDLRRTNRRIVEIALDYRFESQEAFTRAFRRMFAVTPGQFRKQPAGRDAQFRILEKKALDEDGMRHLLDGVTQDPVILAMDKLQLAGLELRGFEPQDVRKLWERFRERVANIPDRRETSGSVRYAVIELAGEQGEVTYTACVEVGGAGRLPEGMVGKVLPARTYAVFTHKGTLARIPDTFQYIYASWLPRSGMQRADAPEFARYDHRYRGPEDARSEMDIYIPVQPAGERKRE